MLQRRKWTRLGVFAATLATAVAAAIGAPAQPYAYPTAVAKSCSASYTHAVIGGSEKCLRAGEFCAHAYDSQYRRYGYRCVKYYANVARYRLTHG